MRLSMYLSKSTFSLTRSRSFPTLVLDLSESRPEPVVTEQRERNKIHNLCSNQHITKCKAAQAKKGEEKK